MSTEHQPDADGSGYTNAEFVADAHADVRDEQERERAEAAEHAATKQWLEESEKSRVRTIEIRDRPFEFTPLSAAESSRLESLGEGVEADSARGEEVTQELCDTLGEHCHDPVLTGDVFFNRFGIDELVAILDELVEGDMDPEDRERVDGFREQ
jgi:hypothetical protein